MTRYIRKPTPIEAFQWNRDMPQKDWPEWAKLYRGTDAMGQQAGIGPGGIGGTLQVPSGQNNMVVESSDWLVFEGEVVTDDEGRKAAKGRVIVVNAADFARDYVAEAGQAEAASEAPATEAPAETPAGDEA